MYRVIIPTGPDGDTEEVFESGADAMRTYLERANKSLPVVLEFHPDIVQPNQPSAGPGATVPYAGPRY